MVRRSGKQYLVKKIMKSRKLLADCSLRRESMVSYVNSSLLIHFYSESGGIPYGHSYNPPRLLIRPCCSLLLHR